MYAADEYVNRLENIYFPILKIIKEDEKNQDIDYVAGNPIRIYKNGDLIGEVSEDELTRNAIILFNRIFVGTDSEKGAFEIPEIDSFLKDMKIHQIKASSADKVDIRIQIHDIKTSYDPVAGFSIKSDLGSPPTLLNAGKNTRFKYKISGIDDKDMNDINAIDKSTDNEYMKLRIAELFKRADNIEYHCMLNDIYEDNLVMIDSLLPQIYGIFILYHYMTMPIMHMDCEMLCRMLEQNNPLKYRNPNIYAYKIKKLLCASALGMTPGIEWNGIESATGGYVIVKRNGDVVCYHIYNRNFFEEYLLRNTTIDRPSASRYDYAYVYKENDDYFIDLNIQIRFKRIKAGSRPTDSNNKNSSEYKRELTYSNILNRLKKGGICQ